MWNKPREITENLYTGIGFEIGVSIGAPAAALELWKNNPAYNKVILNLDIWASQNPWPAVGIGMFGDYAVLWFGEVADPAGSIEICE